MSSNNQILTKCEGSVPVFERQKCEVWTRVMGYYRPVSQFNAGKKSEHKERLPFSQNPVFKLRCEEALPVLESSAS